MVKSSAIYTIGTVLRQVVSFLMLPIYTSYLSVADYGVVEMLSVMLALLSLVAGMQIGQGTIRYYHAAESEPDRRELLSTAYITSIGFGVAVYAAFWLLCQSPVGVEFSRFLLGSEDRLGIMLIFALLLILVPVEEQVYLLMRLRDWPWRFVGLSLLKLLLQLSLNIYFLVGHDLKVSGVVYSAVLTSAIMAIISTAVVLPYAGFRPSRELSMKLVRYAIPISIGTLGYFYTSIGDRYVLQLVKGSESVGVYALGYRLADIVQVLGWLPIMAVWQTKFFEVAKQSDAALVTQRVFTGVSIYLLWMALGIAVLSDNVLRLMATPGFWRAEDVVLPMLLFALFGAAAAFCSFPFYISEKTAWIAKGSWFSAAVMTGLYFLLVPAFGASGAAWSKAGSVAAYTAFLVWFARGIYPLNLPWLRVAGLFALACGLYGAAKWLSPGGAWEWGTDALILALYPLAVFYLPVLAASERFWLKTELGTLITMVRGRWRPVPGGTQ